MSPYARFVYRGVEDGAKAVNRGIAQGLRDAFPLPDESQTPDRLRELAALLIERDALGQADGSEDTKPVDRTRLVLVLEDDPHMREMAVALLEETVLDVVVCETGEDAVALLKKRDGDVAMSFTDVQLSSSMDRVSLARLVATFWPKIHLVVTSDQAEAPFEKLSSEIVFLQKPWRALNVSVLVGRAVRHPALPVR
ncbi:response regulator [Methylobacterium nonmethylotrophicum]|uniref:Response regulator n=1 Tax=Methylobacterium nonmethylotrophicum TaxID=1141884 RepID=A0A4Z0NDH6_9HYPH|nr:response regulator [Methylobacterium nonmethylotrophicum]TGD92494.1 response regulator [Methylobacterium nonmethylotrophicum]